MIDIVVTEVQTKLSSVLIFATATHCCQIAKNSALLLKSSGKKMFLRRKLIAVPPLSNFHKNSRKVAEKYIFKLCRKISNFFTFLIIRVTVFLNSTWYEVKIFTIKHVFDPNFDPKIGRGIFSPNSGNFLTKWRISLLGIWQ